MPSRGRRQPVAARRARPQIAAHGPRRSTDVAGRASGHAIARTVVRRRLAELTPARPRRGRGAGRDRRRRGSARGSPRSPAYRSASSARRATRWWPPACSARRRALRPRADRGRDRRGPDADRARAAAPRGGARADRRHGRTPAWSRGTARVRPAGGPRGQRVPAAPPPRRRRARRAAGGRRLPGAGAGGARAGRRPRADARAARRRWRSTPACRTRGGACARRCARCATATAASTCSRGSPR